MRDIICNLHKVTILYSIIFVDKFRRWKIEVVDWSSQTLCKFKVFFFLFFLFLLLSHFSLSLFLCNISALAMQMSTQNTKELLLSLWLNQYDAPEIASVRFQQGFAPRLFLIMRSIDVCYINLRDINITCHFLLKRISSIPKCSFTWWQ